MPQHAEENTFVQFSDDEEFDVRRAIARKTMYDVNLPRSPVLEPQILEACKDATVVHSDTGY